METAETNIELLDAIRVRREMDAYRDTAYLNMLQIINTRSAEVLKDDLGSQFVKNCGKDLAGEVIRNYFDTSSFYITVDQLAIRILQFSYDNEYDPLSENGGVGSLQKSVLNYRELQSSELSRIAEDLDKSQEKLFQEDRSTDKLDRKGKITYRNSKKETDGTLHDELTGQEGQSTTVIMNGKPILKSDLHADHVQARETATFNSRYITERGAQELREFWNSSDNMQLIHASANESKGDIRVCEVNGKIEYVNARSKEYDPSTDITHKATPEQLADATISQWEKNDGAKKTQVLKEKGYLNDDGKVPKSVRSELIRNIRHSQNVESIKILKNTRYGQVAMDAASNLENDIGKIIAGQVIYYAAPPIVFEVRTILKDKTITLDNALEKLGHAASRITNYVLSRIKDIFQNVLYNSLKKFVKSLMDILIGLVKATVKRLLKMAKQLVLASVDAVRIIADKNATPAEKADSVFSLFGVTITSCVIEVLFEVARNTLKIPAPFDDIVFGPLQILATVICTNLTMLILQKADLFDVRFGYKMAAIRKVFAEEREAYEKAIDEAEMESDETIIWIIAQAKEESLDIYNHLVSLDPHKESVRGNVDRISRMFSMDINFEDEWMRFLGLPQIAC